MYKPNLYSNTNYTKFTRYINTWINVRRTWCIFCDETKLLIFLSI